MSIRKSFARSAVGILALLLVVLAAGGATVTSAASPGTSLQQPVKDKWITMKIHSLFVPEDALEGSNIDVDTVSGVVTLSGTVASAAGRARALAIAKGADGVKSVVDKLQVGPAERELDDIARDAGQATSAAARDAARDTKAVAKEAARDTKAATKEAAKDTKAVAKEAAKDTRAAAATTGRKITDGWVKSKIYAQYLTENVLDDSDIDIDVASGVVTLNGTVKTAAGKARAVAIAKATDRVKGVKDNLKVG